MPLTDAQNEFNEILLYTHVAETYANNLRVNFAVPFPCTITKLVAMYDTEGAGDNSVTVDLRVGTTVLFSVAVTNVQTPVIDTTVAGGQSANRSALEVLNINTTEAGTTPTFGGMCIQVWGRRRLS